MFMYNYLSVGVDAQVTLDFHRARESPFYIISSRLINKVRKFTTDILSFHELLIVCILGIHLQALDVHQFNVQGSVLRKYIPIYEAYSESKGRLVSKKNIFVRHIFY